MSGPRAARIAFLTPDDPPDAFPAVEYACREPEGLLAAGGDLSEARLLYAYRHGIFPWYEEGQPILWWSPEPRCVLRPRALHVASRFRRWLRRSAFSVTFNTAFDAVLTGCGARRYGQHGTWITDEMVQAYTALHRAGWAHSIDVWDGSELVGGLYGIAIGKAFFGESMFSRRSNASKVALLALCRELVAREIAILDCQVVSPHLLSMGATTMPRSDFCREIEAASAAPVRLEFRSAGRIAVPALADF